MTRFAQTTCAHPACGAPSLRSAVGRAVRSGLLAALVALSTGCSPPHRPPVTDADLQERAWMDGQNSEREFRETITGLLARAERASKSSAVDGEPPTLNFLALSGGGDKGAFGAGFLVGW